MAANLFVIFPPSKEASAQAYHDAANAYWSENIEPGGAACWKRPDAFGNWVVQYLGPPWEWPVGTVFQEPEELVPLRVDGVLHTTWVWPEEE